MTSQGVNALIALLIELAIPRGLLRRFAFAYGIAGTSFISVAQTNSTLANMQWFAVSAPQLRTESAAPANPAAQAQKVRAAASPITSGSTESQAPLASSFSISVSREDIDLYRAYQNFGLIQPVLVSRDPLSRGLEAIFRPDEFHLGRRVTFSCSLATAIKRKDPLCLLNPTFLNLSW
jgi:hypothetical protein